MIKKNKRMLIFLLKDQILSRTTTVMEALLETWHEATMMLKKKKNKMALVLLDVTILYLGIIQMPK